MRRLIGFFKRHTILNSEFRIIGHTRPGQVRIYEVSAHGPWITRFTGRLREEHLLRKGFAHRESLREYLRRIFGPIRRMVAR